MANLEHEPNSSLNHLFDRLLSLLEITTDYDPAMLLDPEIPPIPDWILKSLISHPSISLDRHHRTSLKQLVITFTHTYTTSTDRDIFGALAHLSSSRPIHLQIGSPISLTGSLEQHPWSYLPQIKLLSYPSLVRTSHADIIKYLDQTQIDVLAQTKTAQIFLIRFATPPLNYLLFSSIPDSSPLTPSHLFHPLIFRRLCRQVFQYFSVHPELEALGSVIGDLSTFNQ